MALAPVPGRSLPPALLRHNVPVLMRPAEGRDTFLDRRERGKRLVRLGLVPERHRRQIVGAPVGVAGARWSLAHWLTGHKYLSIRPNSHRGAGQMPNAEMPAS